MAEREDFVFDSIQDTQTIREYIQSLLDGMERGSIVLRSEGEEIALHPAAMLKLSIKARKKGSTRKLSIKFSWKEEKESSADTASSLTISS